MQNPSPIPVALTIAGSDSGGGAGIQADLLTFSANEVFGTTAITCLTAQNPASVSAVEAMPAAFVLEQIKQVTRYFTVGALKTGMLFNVEIVKLVATFISENRTISSVVDPVMVATSGAVLLQEDAIHAIRTHLLPAATLITPNLDEAAVLLGYKPANTESMPAAALTLAHEYNTAILLKGGHLADNTLTDVLALPDGTVKCFQHQRIEGVNTHGSGCTLSAAIAAQLALGRPLELAVSKGLDYLSQRLRHPLCVANTRFIAHS